MSSPIPPSIPEQPGKLELFLCEWLGKSATNALITGMKACMSAAAGGIALALTDFFTDAQSDPTKIDWHRLLIKAGAGAVVGMVAHFVPPPNRK